MVLDSTKPGQAQEEVMLKSNCGKTKEKKLKASLSLDE